jgi:uncharacterized membrane protein YqaE (UPF0057 family)
MQIERLILCVIAPPLAVLDQGTNAVILTTFFTVLGWVPGVMVAFGLVLADNYWQRHYAKTATTHQEMQASLQRRESLVNLPESHRSGEDRYQVALRGQAMRERHERKRKGR